MTTTANNVCVSDIDSLDGLVFASEIDINAFEPEVLRRFCQEYDPCHEWNKDLIRDGNTHPAVAIVCDYRDCMIFAPEPILRLEAILDRAYDDLSAANEGCGGIDNVKCAKHLIEQCYTFERDPDDEETDGADIYRAMVACGYMSQEDLDDMLAA